MKNKYRFLNVRSVLHRILLIAVGLIGAILFFPVNLNNTHTCLCDKLIQSAGHTHMIPKPPNVSSNSPEASYLASSHGGHQMLNRYLVPYALLWWISLALVGWQVMVIRKKTIEKLVADDQPAK